MTAKQVGTSSDCRILRWMKLYKRWTYFRKVKDRLETQQPPQLSLEDKPLPRCLKIHKYPLLEVIWRKYY